MFESRRSDTDALAERVRHAARPLESSEHLDPLLDAIGDARFVLLGEASHGTSEYYTWRTELSKRLIREKGFSFIGVEGDWPDCYRVNRYVKGYADAGRSAEEVLHAFERWPTWMWANREVVALAEWMHEHNRSLPPGQQAGFYGLDVYSLWESMSAVVEYLERIDPEAARAARRAYSCFDPYYDDVQEYARATALVPTSCEDEAVAMLGALRGRAQAYSEDGRDAYFNAEQNALVARDAERYYRTMVRGGPTSWNVRDHHMVDTLDRLMEHHGRSAKAIVWEHNTHVGDARATDMARAGMVNVGQLLRQRHSGGAVALVGFASHRGTVLAASAWGAPEEAFTMPEAQVGTLEALLHDTLGKAAVLVFPDDRSGPWLSSWMGHRAIGVVYNRHHETGNYVPTRIGGRYDALLWLERTSALRPLHHEPSPTEPELETEPTGF